MFSLTVLKTLGLIDAQENNDMQHAVKNTHEAICKNLDLPCSPNKPEKFIK